MAKRRPTSKTITKPRRRGQPIRKINKPQQLSFDQRCPPGWTWDGQKCQTSELKMDQLVTLIQSTDS